MQCITANVTQIIFTGTIQLKNAFHPAIDCSIMPTQTVTVFQTQARCRSLSRKHKELNLLAEEEKFSC